MSATDFFNTVSQQNNLGMYDGGYREGAAVYPAPAYVPAPYTGVGSTSGNTSATDTGTGGGGYSTPVYDPYAAQRAEAASQAAQAISAYDRLLGELPGQQAASQQIVGNQYKSNYGTLQEGKNAGMRNLALNRSTIGENRDRSFRDLQQQLTSQFDSGMTMLGNRGAGDSSATGMYSYALSKLGNQNRSNLQQQANQQLSQVNLAETNLLGDFSSKMNELNTWKANKLLEIAQNFNSQRANLNAEKARLGGEWSGPTQWDLAKHAVAQLGSVENAYRDSIKQFNSGINAGGQYAQAGTQFGKVNTNPTALRVDPVSGLPIGQGQEQAGQPYVAPVAPRRTWEEQNGLS